MGTAETPAAPIIGLNGSWLSFHQDAGRGADAKGEQAQGQYDKRARIHHSLRRQGGPYAEHEQNGDDVGQFVLGRAYQALDDGAFPK